MNFTVYCDESRHTGGPGARYCVLGSLWVQTDNRDKLSGKIRQLRKDHGLKAEIKWSKVSALKLGGYESLVRLFLDSDTNFRCIIVDQDKVNNTEFNRGDAELGFYKFHYEMLEKWLAPGNTYTILLDYKNNKLTGRIGHLKTCLQNYGRVRKVNIHSVDTVFSDESNVAQMCDLLTGAVAAEANGTESRTPKGQLIETLAAGLQRSRISVASPNPALSKFNVFRINLK